jgi:hypothetical protein
VGYSTDFDGHLKFNRTLTADELAYIKTKFWLESDDYENAGWICPKGKPHYILRVHRRLLWHQMGRIGKILRGSCRGEFHPKAGRAATAAAERITEVVIVPHMICWDLADGAIQRTRREELARKGLIFVRALARVVAVGSGDAFDDPEVEQSAQLSRQSGRREHAEVR